MKHVLAVGLFVLFGLLLTVSVHAASERECLGWGSAAILLDTGTTYVGLRKGAVESNPLIGRNPSVGRQLAVAGLKLGGNWYVCTHATDAQRTGWTVFVTLTEGSIGIANLQYSF